MGKLSLYTFLSVLLFSSCVPKKEADFVTFSAPELQRANDFSTLEEQGIDIVIPEMEIGSDEASQKMGERYAYRIVKQPSFGRVENCLVGKSRECKYFPNKDFFGTDEFRYVAFDGPLESNVITLKIDVENINDAPTFVDGELYRVAIEDQLTKIDLEEALDVDGDQLTYTIVDTPSNGYLEKCFESDISCFYKSDPDFFGKDRISYMASDGQYNTKVKIVNIDVRPSNDRPAFADTTINVSTYEDQTKKVATAFATDAEQSGKDLNYIITSFPRLGTLSNCGKGTSEWSCTYSPAPNLNGFDSFSIVAVDDSGEQSEPLVFAINVIPVADAPFFANKKVSVSGNEDTVITIRLEAARDYDNDIKSYNIKTAPQKGTLYGCLNNTMDLICTYRPEKDFYGPIQFSYEVVDKSGLKATMPVELKVNPVNDRPYIVFKNKVEKVTEDTTLRFNLSRIVDVDDDVHTYYNFSATKQGRLSCSASACTYVPNTNFYGTDTFTYTVRDSGGLTDNGRVTLSVEEVDDAPAVMDVEYDLYEDNKRVFNIPRAIDLDTANLTYELVSGPSKGKLSNCLVGNKIANCVYTPNGNFYGKDEFTYSVKDSINVVKGKVIFNVLPVNDNPYWIDKSNKIIELYEDTPKVLNLDAANDLEDGANVEYVLISAPVNGLLEVDCFKARKLNCKYTPKANYYGTDSFKYKAMDSAGVSTTVKTYTLDIKPVNDVPVTRNIEVVVVEDSAKRFNIPKAVDDNNKLTYATVKSPVNGVVTQCFTLNKINNCLYTPNKDFYGDDVLIYSIDDGETTVNAKVTFKVTPVNDRPVWDNYNPRNFKVNEDEKLNMGLTAAKDAEDGRALEYSFVKLPSHGRISVSCLVNRNLNCSYEPNPNFYGTDTFSYIAADKQGLKTVLKTETITIKAVNDPPRIADLEIGTRRNQQKKFRLPPVVDVDSFAFTWSLKSNVANGTLTGCVNGNTVYPNNVCVYTPTTDFEGVDGFEVQVSDGQYAAVSRVSIKVEDPYIREDRNEIDVEGREKPLIKIAMVIDDTASMNVYQEQLVSSLTPMFEKLHGYNVELDLYSISTRIDNGNFVSPSRVDEENNRKYGKVVLDTSKHNVVTPGYREIRISTFKVDPKATEGRVKQIASSIAQEVKKMGASSDELETGMHKMAFLMAHDESPFLGDMKYGGFIILSNENSYNADSEIENDVQKIFHKERWRERRERNLYCPNPDEDEDCIFDKYRLRYSGKAKVAGYHSPVYSREGVRRWSGSQYSLCNTKQQPWLTTETGAKWYQRKTNCDIPQEDLYRRNNKIHSFLCVPCVEEDCSKVGSFQDGSYLCESKRHPETRNLYFDKPYTVSDEFSGIILDASYPSSSYTFRYDEDTEENCADAREKMWAKARSEAVPLKLIPETGCEKSGTKRVMSFDSPSINSSVATPYPLVSSYLERAGKSMSHLRYTQHLQDMIVDLADERIGLDKAYFNFIIHDKAKDLEAGCSDVVGKNGATEGVAYQELHQKLVEEGVANSSIHSICSGDYSNALDGLKTFIEEKTDNVFFTGVEANQRLFSIEVTRKGKLLNFVKNKEFVVSKDGSTVTFSKGILEPNDKIVFVIRTYAQ